MNRYIFTAAAAGLLCFSVSGPAKAMDKEHPSDPVKMQQRLGLTADQSAKMKSVMEAQKTALKPLWEKRKASMEKLEAQVKSKAPDSDIQATLTELKENRKAVRDQMEQFQDQREAILTPTQQAQMMMHRMEHRRDGGHGKGQWKADHDGAGDGAPDHDDASPH